MYRREFLKKCGVLVAGSAPLAFCRTTRAKSELGSEKESPPNIVVIVADDMGLQLGCYGDTISRTPNIDRLASDGVRFETVYATQPSCSPSRSSIYTGLYPHQNGQYGLAHMGYSMKKLFPNIPHLLEDNGYTTAVVGKFHVRPALAFSWDYSFREDDAVYVSRDVKKMCNFSDYLFNNIKQPFFLMFNLFDPHRPFINQTLGLPAKPFKPDDVKPFSFLGMDEQIIREEVAGYYNGVSRVDYAVGMLLEKLRKSNKRDNTIIFFLSDQGPAFTRSKTTCYDAGLRIPLIVNGPKKFIPQVNRVRTELVSTVDILPTILDIAGIENKLDLPGKSLLPLLRSENIPWRQYLFAEHNTHTPKQIYPRRTVRTERYHLIYNLLSGQQNPLLAPDGCKAWRVSRRKKYNGTQIRQVYNRCANPPEYELYDILKDPDEFVNIAGKAQYSNIEQNLSRVLLQWQRSTNDLFLDKAMIHTELEIR